MIEIGGSRLQGCVVLPAMGTRGGAAIFWDKQIINITSHFLGSFSIMVRVEPLHSRDFFWMTNVCGPTHDGQKDMFLTELAAAAPPTGEPWLINGDFNMIYQARDKSNSNLNRRMMGKIRKAIDQAGLKEVKCENRRYTWSNEREDPTFCSIDKFFCNIQWEDNHSDYLLAAESTSFSDHCPLLLTKAATPFKPASFKFENFWPKAPHFMETVQRAWQRPVQHDCPFVRVKKRMARVTEDLKIWSKHLFGKTKMQFHIANEVILRLDVAQESRLLSPTELRLRKQLKLKVLGLAAIERVRRKQASRIGWLRAGDASTKFFHAKMRARRRKNFILSLKIGDREVSGHAAKEQAIHEHFAAALGKRESRR